MYFRDQLSTLLVFAHGIETFTRHCICKHQKDLIQLNDFDAFNRTVSGTPSQL